jgi:dTDP-4-amino-4,6-dideoxyglucose
MLTKEGVEALIGPDTAAILGVHVWGRACDPMGLSEVAGRHGLKLIFDAAHAVACTFQGRRIGAFGDAEVFSFHATKVLNGLEGGCIATDDDDLAQRLKIARSFHAPNAPNALWRMNAKISEAQAAMTLLGMRELERLVEDNSRRYEAYRSGLRDVPGLRFLDYAQGERSNYQYVVAAVAAEEFGMTRDALQGILRDRRVFARRYFFPGVHRTPPFSNSLWNLPVTDDLCQSLVQLPNSQVMTEADVGAICAIIRGAAKG